jgi:hypothetical protein
MGAQFDLVGWTLHDIARGDHVLGAHDLMSWGTNFSYTDEDGEEFTLAFDLLLFMDRGEPTVVVVNREI